MLLLDIVELLQHGVAVHIGQLNVETDELTRGLLDERFLDGSYRLEPGRNDVAIGELGENSLEDQLGSGVVLDAESAHGKTIAPRGCVTSIVRMDQLTRKA